jgi:protein-S-isoprenylcysteine O-methyltransferase Ste14
MSLGVAVGYASLIGLAGFVLLLIPGFIFRIHVEENLLLTQFGAEYEKYAAHTRKLIPGIW